MKRPFVKLLTLLLALALLVSIVPAALADDVPVTLDQNHIFKDAGSNLSDYQFINGREALENKIIINDPGNLHVGDTISLSKIISTTDMTKEEIEAGVLPYVWDGEKGDGQKFYISAVQRAYSGNPKRYLLKFDDVEVTPWTEAKTVLKTPFPRDRDFKKGSNGLSITWTLDPKTKATFDTVTYDFNLPSKDGTRANPYYVENLNDLGIANAYFNEAYISGDDLYSLKTTGESVIVGSSIPYWPNAVARHADFIGIVGGIPTEPNGSNIQTFYRFLGWKIQGSDTLYSKTNMPEMTEGGISLVAQWEEVDLDQISLTPAQEALKIPFSDAATITYEDQTSEVVDAVISQHNSSDEAAWSQNNANDPLSLQSDRIVYYKAELTMNDFIAGTGNTSLGYGFDILANRPIDDPTFASFQIDVDLDDHLQVVENNDGYVSFTFTCSFLQPVTDGQGSAKITTADSTIWTNYTSNTVNVNVSENSNIKLSVGAIAGLPTTSTAYTYTVPAKALTSNAFTLHMEWKPVGGGGYSYQKLLSPITLEVAAAKISADFNGVVQTTGKITGSIDLRKAETGKSESEVATYLQNDPEWFEAFQAEDGETPDVEDIFRKTKIVRDSLANVYLTANTVYAEVPTYDVTIRYLEKGSKDVLADSVTISDVYSDTTLDLIKYLDKDIRGYRQVEVEVVTDNTAIDDGKMVMPSGDVVIHVYYERNPILPIIPEVPDDTIPNWLNLDDHYAYIIGYDDGTVKPENNITRAEVATIFFRLLTDEAREYFWSTDSGFSDVKSSDWYNNAVSTMVNAGIITGYNDGTFRPNDPITRAEFATIAARFLSDPYSLQDRFYDTEGHWAEVYINRAAEVGWINGYNDGSFRPDKAITRAEAMTLVNAVLGREPHKDHLLPNMIIWPDNPKTAWYYEEIQEATNSHDYDWASSGAYEIWTALLENRQWAKLEKEWSNAYSAPGGEVMQ